MRWRPAAARLRRRPAAIPSVRHGRIGTPAARRPTTTSTRTAPGYSTRCLPAAAREPRRSRSKRAWTSTRCCAAWAGWPVTASSNAAIAAGAWAGPVRGPPGRHPSGRRAPAGPADGASTASRDLGVQAVLGVRVVAESELELQIALPGQVLQAVPLDVLRVGQADHPKTLPGQPLVDLVEMLADQDLLGVGDLPLVRLARVPASRVVEPVPARAT